MQEQLSYSLAALSSLSPGSGSKPVIIAELGRAPGDPPGQGFLAP